MNPQTLQAQIAMLVNKAIQSGETSPCIVMGILDTMKMDIWFQLKTITQQPPAILPANTIPLGQFERR